MLRTILAALACFALSACQTTRGRPMPPPVSDGLIDEYSEAHRQALGEARTARDTARDGLARARRELTIARERLDVAEEERDVARERVDQAREEKEVAVHGTPDQVVDAKQRETTARHEVSLARACGTLRRAEIARAEAQV